MVPKKPAELIKSYAEGKDIPVDDLTDMINGYYREVKRHCSEMDYPIQDIRGLGYIKASHRKVMMGIRKLETELKGVPEENKGSWYDVKRRNLTRLREMKDKIEKEWDKEDEKKQLKKLYKQQYGLEGDTQTGMEQQGSDS